MFIENNWKTKRNGSLYYNKDDNLSFINLMASLGSASIGTEILLRNLLQENINEYSNSNQPKCCRECF